MQGDCSQLNSLKSAPIDCFYPVSLGIMKIAIAGAGGAPSEGVIFSLMQNPDNELIGLGADLADLQGSMATSKRLVPYANEADYSNQLLEVLEIEKPALIHFQNDAEIFVASQMRNKFHELGIKTYMPDHEVIDTCVHKYKTYLAFSRAGIKVPRNILISNEEDLKNSFSGLGNLEGKIWLRSANVGGGGQGSLGTSSFDFAKAWIEANSGWGTFLAAELLTPNTITWQSIWHEGDLVVAQTRRRDGWIHGNRTISGITGVTKIGITDSDHIVDEIAMSSVRAVDPNPHGIYGVDMTYDLEGVPNPTEINISRFFTTIRFFTEAGLNMPEIFLQIGLGKFKFPSKPIINPLPNGLCWLRGMDRAPVLSTLDKLPNL